MAWPALSKFCLAFLSSRAHAPSSHYTASLSRQRLRLTDLGTPLCLPLVNGAHRPFDLPSAQSREVPVRWSRLSSRTRVREGIHTSQKAVTYMQWCVKDTHSSPSLPNLMSWAPKQCDIQTNVSQPSVRTAVSLCAALPWRTCYPGHAEAQHGPAGPTKA